MIGYLEGTLLHSEPDGILLLVNHIGYEVMVNPQIVEKLISQGSDRDTICLYIYYHQTDRQPKPVLIGFETREEKEFFQTFITVDAIGPMKAVKAMTRPAREIATAIEKKDVTFLTGLSGIGKRTAEKIIATLRGKVEKFAGMTEDVNQGDITPLPKETGDMAAQVEDVLVEQLGHSQASAKRLVKEAFERNRAILTAEELFDEIYHGG